MTFKYEAKSGNVVEIAGPGGELIVIKEGSPYETEIPLVEYPQDALKVTETKPAKETAKPAEEGAGS